MYIGGLKSDITSLMYLHNKQLLLLHTKEDEVSLIQPLHQNRCSLITKTALIKLNHSVPEHAILGKSPEENDIGVLFSEDRISILLDFGNKNFLKNREDNLFFKAEVTVGIMREHKIAQFRILGGRRVIILSENFGVFLYKYNDFSCQFLSFCDFSVGVNTTGMLSHVFEVSDDEKFICVSTHHNELGARDKLFVLKIQENGVENYQKIEFMEPEKYTGSLIFCINMNFKLQGKQIIVCHELGNSQKVEIFEENKSTKNFKKIDYFEKNSNSVSLMMRRINGGIWSIDMDGGIYFQETPDSFIRDLTPPQQRINMSDYLKQNLVIKNHQVNNIMESELLYSEITDPSVFIKSGGFMMTKEGKRTTIQQENKYKEYEYTYIRQDGVKEIRRTPNRVVNENYQNYPKTGDHYVNRKSPVVRVNRYTRIIEHTPNGRRILQPKAQQQYFNYEKSPMKYDPDFSDFKNQRSRTPVRENQGVLKRLSYARNQENYEEVVRREASPSKIGKRFGDKEEEEEREATFNFENIFNKGLTPSVKNKRESITVKEELGKERSVTPIKGNKKKRNHPKSYTMIRNPGRGINLLKVDEDSSYLDYIGKKSSKRNSEWNKVKITEDLNKTNEGVKVSPFMQDRKKKKSGESKSTTKDLTPKNQKNMNATVEYNTKQREYLLRNSAKGDFGGKILDPILDNSQTLNLTNPNILRTDPEFKDWSYIRPPRKSPYNQNDRSKSLLNLEKSPLKSVNGKDNTIEVLKRDLKSPNRMEKEFDKSTSQILKELDLTVDNTQQVVKVKNIDFFAEEEEFSFESPKRENLNNKSKIMLLTPEEQKSIICESQSQKGSVFEKKKEKSQDGKMEEIKEKEEDDEEEKTLIDPKNVSNGAMTFQNPIKSQFEDSFKGSFDGLKKYVKNAKCYKSKFALCNFSFINFKVLTLSRFLRTLDMSIVLRHTILLVIL